MERAYSVSYLISYWNKVLLVSFNTTGAHIHTHLSLYPSGYIPIV